MNINYSSCRVIAVLLYFCPLVFSFSCQTVFAAGDEKGPKPIKAIEIITVDDSGRGITFPSFVYHDDFTEETYVLTGGATSKISVFGPEYFPEISLGALRGVYSANGFLVTEQGDLYICQNASAGKPARITILSAAFFVQKEIFIEHIPGVAEFSPNRIAISREGNIYLVGNNIIQGVLVLDSEGRFLRWLTPTDKIQKIQEINKESAIDLGVQQTGRKNKKKSAPLDETEQASGPDSDTASESTDSAKDEEEGALSSAFMPKIKESNLELFAPEEFGPVTVSDILIDSSGKIYLLSDDRGKIYVYSAKEQFLFAMGQKGGSSGKMSRPRGFALDKERGYVYVVDYMRHTVLVFNMRTGRFMYEFGGRGTSPGWFNYPTSVAVDRRGNVIVADFFNRRVQVLDVNLETAIPVLQQIPGAYSIETEQAEGQEENSPSPETGTSDGPEKPGDLSQTPEK